MTDFKFYNAFHTLWVKPGKGKKRYSYESPANILVAVLSALKWKQLNGGIKLYTDKEGYNLFNKFNLLNIWNRGIDTSVVEKMSKEVDPRFYALSSVYAYEYEPINSFILDIDCIVLDTLIDLANESDILCTTRDSLKELKDTVYRPKEDLNIPEGYKFEDGLDWEFDPFQSSVLLLKNTELREKYIQNAKEYTKGERKTVEEWDMAYIDQRYPAMLANKMGLTINALGKNCIHKSILHTHHFKTYLNTIDYIELWFSQIILKEIEKIDIKVFNTLIDSSVFKKYINKDYINNNIESYDELVNKYNPKMFYECMGLIHFFDK